MGFIRIKTRKNVNNGITEYAYLVSNNWRKRKKTPRQKVLGYLGKIYRFERINENISVGVGDFHTELGRLLEGMLNSIGFTKRDGKFIYGDVIVDLKRIKVFNSRGKECVIMINDGFLCSWSLKRLFEIEHPKVEDASYIAKSLRMAGISIDGENFVRLLKV